MAPIKTALLLALLPVPVAASADPTAPAANPAIALTTPAGNEAGATGADGTRRLSPDQAEAAIESGAETHAFDPDDLAIAAPSRGIHGEFGAEIGSRGERAAYGVATVPIGESSQATVAFETSRSPHIHGW